MLGACGCGAAAWLSDCPEPEPDDADCDEPLLFFFDEEALLLLLELPSSDELSVLFVSSAGCSSVVSCFSARSAGFTYPVLSSETCTLYHSFSDTDLQP